MLQIFDCMISDGAGTNLRLFRFWARKIYLVVAIVGQTFEDNLPSF